MAVNTSYALNLMIAVDVLGNALTGGSRWHTISARTGYHAFAKGASRGMRRMLWKLLARVIDWSFKPVQGKGHCRKAWRREACIVSTARDRPAGEGGRFQGGNAVGTILIAIPIVGFCPVIYAVNRVLSWFGVRLKDAAGW